GADRVLRGKDERGVVPARDAPQRAFRERDLPGRVSDRESPVGGLPAPRRPEREDRDDPAVLELDAGSARLEGPVREVPGRARAAAADALAPPGALDLRPGHPKPRAALAPARHA